MSDEDLSYLAEGTEDWASAGVNLADLEARGFFADVTAEHRRKASAYFAAIEAKHTPRQGDLFA